MPISDKQALIAGKIQTTAGTFLAPTPTAAADWFEAYDFDIEPMVVDRKELPLAKTVFGSNPQRFYNHNVKASFKVALAGSGTAATAPWWGVIQRVSGLAQTLVATPASVKYNPISTGFEIGSFAYYVGPILHTMRDARATYSLSITRGEYLEAKVDVTGIYIDPTTITPIISPITPRVAPEILLNENTALTFYGKTNLCLVSLDFDLGNEIKAVSYLNKTCTSGILISDRQSKGSIEFLADSFTLQRNWFTDAKNYVNSNLLFTLAPVTAPAGKTIAINMPKLQLMPPKYGSVDGNQTFKIDYIVLPTAGNDDFTITTS